MRQLLTRVHRFVSSEDGPTAVEYAVMLALIIVVCMGAIRLLGGAANTAFGNAASSISTAAGGSSTSGS